jgi:hypothetical protein
MNPGTVPYHLIPGRTVCLRGSEYGLFDVHHGEILIVVVGIKGSVVRVQGSELGHEMKS